MMAMLIVAGGIVLVALSAVAALSVYAARTEIRQQIEGERIAKWLSQYHYPSGMFRPDSWHPDRTGANRP